MTPEQRLQFISAMIPQILPSPYVIPSMWKMSTAQSSTSLHMISTPSSSRNFVSSSDSGILSAQSKNPSTMSMSSAQLLAPSTSFSSDSPVSPSRVVSKRIRKDFCKVCKSNIFKEGGKSQGPQRHIHQFHLDRKVYLCPHCDYGSKYDKAHVVNHIKKLHNGQGEIVKVPRIEYCVEEQYWMEKCFGDESDEDTPTKIIRVDQLAEEEKENQPIDLEMAEKSKDNKIKMSQEERFRLLASLVQPIFPSPYVIPPIWSALIPPPPPPLHALRPVSVMSTPSAPKGLMPSPDSGFLSAQSTSSSSVQSFASSLPSTTNTPVTAKSNRKEYCKVCKKNIFKEGGRSQGPQRHILQYHLGKTIYLCPHCPYGVKYDRAHVLNHIKRIHNNVGEPYRVPRQLYIKEEQKWMEACFGENSDGLVPSIVQEEQAKQTIQMKEKEEKENEAKEGEKEENEKKTFSIEDILSE